MALIHSCATASVLDYGPYLAKLHIVLHLSQRRHNLHWVCLAGLLLDLRVL